MAVSRLSGIPHAAHSGCEPQTPPPAPCPLGFGSASIIHAIVLCSTCRGRCDHSTHECHSIPVAHSAELTCPFTTTGINPQHKATESARNRKTMSLLIRIPHPKAHSLAGQSQNQAGVLHTKGHLPQCDRHGPTNVLRPAGCHTCNRDTQHLSLSLPVISPQP